MRHILLEVSDVPVLPPVVERRLGPAERRAVWRGGRRDSDWVNRPPRAFTQLETGQSVAWALRRAVSSVLHLW